LLTETDTKTLVTIIDDDKPGFLSFKAKKGHIKHIATEDECKLIVQRTNGCDGKIECKYRTCILTGQGRGAVADKDFIPTEGTLIFEHNENEQEIVVEIPQRDSDDKEERNEVFGVQIYDAHPSEVKISKKDTCMIEIVKDAETQK